MPPHYEQVGTHPELAKRRRAGLSEGLVGLRLMQRRRLIMILITMENVRMLLLLRQSRGCMAGNLERLNLWSEIFHLKEQPLTAAEKRWHIARHFE